MKYAYDLLELFCIGCLLTAVYMALTVSAHQPAEKFTNRAQVGAFAKESGR